MSQKSTFLEALLMTILIFGIGILVGIWLESYRSSKIDTLYENSELELLDLKSQEQFIELVSCESAIEELTNFANKIYEEAKLLDKYESASRLTEELVVKHKKYDLLRADLFISSLKTKERCNAQFHIITYFYKYKEPNVETKAKQNVFSKVLMEVKKSKPEREIILIPLAADVNLTSVNILLKKYNITELPTILIDEEVKLTKIEQLTNLTNTL